jgi:hypothetical protein
LNKILKEVKSRTLICPICAIQFITHHGTKKYCSSRCHLKHRQNFLKEYKKEYNKKPENKQKQVERLKIIFKENYKDPEYRNKIPEAQKKQRKRNPERFKERDKEQYWKRKNNPLTYKRDRQYQNNWLKNKKKEDPYYKIRSSLSASLFQFLKREGTIKYGSITQLIGVSKDELKKHLESKWYANPRTGEMMTWDNYGLKGWHVDHIIPFEAFKKYDVTKEETQKKIMALNNLQPMWAYENISKSNKY